MVDMNCSAPVLDRVPLDNPAFLSCWRLDIERLATPQSYQSNRLERGHGQTRVAYSSACRSPTCRRSTQEPDPGGVAGGRLSPPPSSSEDHSNPRQAGASQTRGAHESRLFS